MKRLFVLSVFWGAISPALADEGMWTFDNFPIQKVKQKYGFEPSQAWLNHLRLSSVKLGASGSIVSPKGLVMTNEHVARNCLQQLSNAQHDYVANGYIAKTEADELKCPNQEVNQLTAISDVTARVERAGKGLKGAARNQAEKTEMSKIEKECTTGEQSRCDVVTLYYGGQYKLYQYRHYADVRLVFAPELSTAYFGGDPDNFMFPRYALDVAFLRLYDNGAPAKTDEYFRFSIDGAKEGDLTFVSGHPGVTNRLRTVAELEFLRDRQVPEQLLRFAEERGLLTDFQDRGPEQRRISTSLLLGVENNFKRFSGFFSALVNPAFFKSKAAAEQALRAKVQRLPGKQYSAAWGAIARSIKEYETFRKPYLLIEQRLGTRSAWTAGDAFSSELYEIAKTLVRAADELPKPDEKRLREFAASKIPAVKEHLFSSAPIYPEFEIVRLTFSLTKLREILGPDDPLVKKILGQASPKELATTLIRGSHLADPKLRRALYEGGKKVVEASDDPMIQFARKVDVDARALRSRYEDEVEPVQKTNTALIAKAMFEIHGTSIDPDATGTLRLSYGQVKGFPSRGGWVKPLTEIAGAFDRATGREPFQLPKSWLEAKAKLNLQTPLNFCSTNDIIGGNSGSPILNRDGEIVGVIFDGNIESLEGDFWYDESTNRAVAVHSSAILEALEKIYRADRILGELRPEQRSHPVTGGASGQTR